MSNDEKSQNEKMAKSTTSYDPHFSRAFCQKQLGTTVVATVASTELIAEMPNTGDIDRRNDR